MIARRRITLFVLAVLLLVLCRASFGGSPATASLIYAAAGNLVLDDDYFYQYDGWGRLVKVSHRHTLELDATGQHVSGAEGEWIVHFTFDALGRMARLQRPLTAISGWNHTEHYYYDGVRRIQEVFTSLEAPPSAEENSSEEQSPSLTTWTDREYIHTAGPGSYVDEYVCEVGSLNTSQTPLFHLQDANYNVLGLVSAAGQVARQYTLDPYGQLLHRENFIAAFESRIDHQGLFFLRAQDHVRASAFVRDDVQELRRVRSHSSALAG